MITLILPPPVSSNRYWRPARIGERITIVPTKEAKDYRKAVAWLAASAGVRTPLQGRLEMLVQLYPHRPLDADKRMRDHGDLWDDDVRCIDLGNCEKVLSDALQGSAIVDDKQLWRINLERMEPDGEARVVVRISQLQPRQRAQLALA